MKRSISFVATTARSSLGTGGLSPASRPWRSLGVTPRTYDRIMQKIAEAAGALIEALTQALAGFDPGCLSGSEALELVEVLARGEKVCAAMRARRGGAGKRPAGRAHGRGDAGQAVDAALPGSARAGR